MWDTPVSTWAGEGEIFGARDVDAPPTSPSPKKDEVIVALLKMTRQPTKHLLKKDAGVSSTKHWELDPIVLDAPGKGEGIQVEIGGARGLVEEWEDKVDLDWCDATGICGFGDGSCRSIGCG